MKKETNKNVTIFSRQKSEKVNLLLNDLNYLQEEIDRFLNLKDQK